MCYLLEGGNAGAEDSGGVRDDCLEDNEVLVALVCAGQTTRATITVRLTMRSLKWVSSWSHGCVLL